MSPSEVSISHLKETLDRVFGKGVWEKWEPETIAIELGVTADDLMMDKLNLLKILVTNHYHAFNDPLLFIYASEVINNNVADFDQVPHITMLEAAFSLSEIKKILTSEKIVPEFTNALITTSAYILNREGASEPMAPFDFVPAELLSQGQTKEDTEAKKRAISTYIKHMESL